MTKEFSVSRRFFGYFVLFVLGVDLLAGILSALRLLSLPALLLLIFNYLCELLTLVGQFAGLGGAFYLLWRGHVRQGVGLFSCAMGGLLLALLVAGIAESINYIGYNFDAALLSQIASAFLNTAVYYLLYGAVLLAVYHLFLKKKCKKTAPLHLLAPHPIAHASLTVALVGFAEKLLFQILETVEFVNTYWPNIYDEEIVTMVLDFVFILISSVLSYFVAMLAAQLFATEEID